MTLKRNQIEIYSAGKTWAAAGFKDMRDNYGFNINARWIDLPETLDSPDAEFDYENTDFSYLEKMWDHGCKIDACFADAMVLYARPEDGEKHSGSLVELGHITSSYAYTGIQKPVYLVGTCKSFEKVGHSDRGFKHQRVFHTINTQSMLDGFHQATLHYAEHYYNDWINWRVFLRKNKFHRDMVAYCRGEIESPHKNTA